MALRMKNMAVSFVISLAFAVISLSTSAGAAVAPLLTVRPTWVPVPGFGHALGKMATDASGTIYVADYTQKAIVKLNSSGQYVGRISTASIGSPFGIAVLKNGNIVVTFQSPQPRIVMFDPAGTIISNGTDLGNATLQHPTAVVVDGLDNIYVLDGGSMRGEQYTDANGYVQLTNSYPSVHVFRKTGAKYLTTPYIGTRPAGYADNSFGTISRLYPLQPTDDKGFGMLGGEGMAYDPVNKRILVADTTNGRVIAFASAEAPQPFIQLSKPGSPSVPLQWGTSAITTPGNDLVDGHMAAPVGIALEVAANRLYVVDKTLQRIKVFDYETGAMLKLLDTYKNPSFSMTMPRDIMLYKGNLLLTSEHGKNPANLVTIGIDSAQWPPITVLLSIDPFPPNITTQPGNIFRFTGKVEAGASVTWTNASYSGSCVIPNPVGYGLESFYCDVTMDTTNGSAGTYQTITLTASKNGNSSSVAAAPAPLYTTAASLRPAPVVVSNPPDAQYVKTSQITLTGTIDYSATGASGGAMVKLVNTHDNATYYAIVDNSVSGNAKPWSAQVLLEEGTNTFTIAGWAEMTGTGSAASQTVTLDVNAPSIIIGFLPEGAVTTKQVLNLNGTVSDETLKSVSIFVNGISQYGAIPADPVRGYFSGVIELTKNGNNAVMVVAEDMAGNVATMLRNVTLEPMKGVPVTFTNPAADNIVITAPQTSLDLTCTADPRTTTVRFGNSDMATKTGEVWNATTTQFIPSQGVIRTIPVEASGPYGKLNDVRTVFLDSTAPALSITDPPTDISTNSNSVLSFGGTFDVAYDRQSSPVVAITAQLLDAYGAVVSTYSVVKNDVAKTFSGSIPLAGLSEGRYSLKIQATDQAGVSTFALRNVLIDRKAPVVGFCVDPTNASTLYGATESGTIVNNSDNRSMVLSGNIWSVDRTSLPANFTVTATDPAGNTTTIGLPAPNPYDGDMDGDGAVRVYDAVIALRAIANMSISSTQIAHGDISTMGHVTAGLSCPDGSLTIEDVQLILAKAAGKTWQ